MGAEGFVEISAPGLDFGRIEIVDDNALRKMTEMIAFDFKLLDSLTELADLGLLRIIHKNVGRRCVGNIQVAHERALGVVEVTAFRLDCLASLTGIFLLPLRDDVEVCLHFEKALENEREGLGRWLFEGENLDVVIVEAEMAAMAFEVRFAEVVVEKRIVLEPCKPEFQRREIQRSL